MSPKRFVGPALLSLVVGLGGVLSPLAQAQTRLDSASAKSRVYLLTATYGVVAGSLTGLGSLAFYDSPSKHARNIAMGASLGLYVGLLLGAYMIYGSDDSSPSNPGNRSTTPAGSPNKSGPVLEDPLRLDSSRATSTWAPFLAYDETRKSMVAGFSLVY